MKYNALLEMQKHPEILEIMEHHSFLSLKNIRHHGRLNCYGHTVSVAEKSYRLARVLRQNPVLAARAALLHDLYLYDLRTEGPGFHIFRHPKISLVNAKKYFNVSKIEHDAILRHMFPLTPVPPRYAVSIIVSIVDKYAAVLDYAKCIRFMFKKRIKHR